MAYPTLSDVKTYLGIAVADYDSYLTIQLAAVIEAVEQYCQRKFPLAADEDEWTRAKYQYDFTVSRYPLATVTAMTVDGTAYDETTGRIVESEGVLQFDTAITGDVIINYTGGFETIPAVVTQVIYDAVGMQYEGKDTGNTTGAIKSERIDGVSSISYFEPGSGFEDAASQVSPLIAQFASSLDPYMSERAIGAAS